MRYLVSLFLLAFLFSTVPAQNREQAIKELEALKERVKVLDAVILQADRTDIDNAAKENANVFRILPREKYDVGLPTVRGGGAYYSFVGKSHSYNDTPQISLEQNYLSVGFYGTSYGFMTDLGEISLAEINRETAGVDFLANYQPPTEISKARIEQEKGNGKGFENDGVTYRRSLPAVVGHTYALRAVSYDEADVLVALRIYRKDTDGSLIVFWKLIDQFEKPQLIKEAQASIIKKNPTESAAVTFELAQKIEKALSKKGFQNVTVDYSTIPLTLRGTIPKGKMAEAIQTAQETSGKPIRNELTEQ